MKNPNQTLTYKKPIKALAAASALAIAASGIGTYEANASTPQTNKPIPAATTEVNALTNIITSLEQGKQATVTAERIGIPGSIREADGQPIVFNVNGQPFLAYRQQQEANFNKKGSADVANEMAIVKEPLADMGMPLEQAHLDKAGVLVNGNQTSVGYSSGGNSGK